MLKNHSGYPQPVIGRWNRVLGIPYWFQCLPIMGILIAFFQPVQALDPSLPEIKSRILLGIERTVVNDFEGAEQVFQQLRDAYPDEPFGYFYLAATLQAKMLDEENYEQLPQFEAYLKQCLQKAERLRETRQSDPWLYFYEGSAFLYRSFMLSKMGKWWSAYRTARKGVKYMQLALKLDSTLVDALLGIGSYKYWKSSKARFLTWLPFIPDERQKGVRMIRRAIQRGHFVRLVGRDQLAWVLWDYGHLQEALKLAEENYRRYPGSRFFKWTLVSIYQGAGRWERAYRLYQELLNEVRQSPRNNHYNEIICLLHLAEIDYQRGNYVSADSLANVALRIKFSPEMRKRIRPKLKKILGIKRKSQKKLSRKLPINRGYAGLKTLN